MCTYVYFCVCGCMRIQQYVSDCNMCPSIWTPYICTKYICKFMDLFECKRACVYKYASLCMRARRHEARAYAPPPCSCLLLCIRLLVLVHTFSRLFGTLSLACVICVPFGVIVTPLYLVIIFLFAFRFSWKRNVSFAIVFCICCFFLEAIYFHCTRESLRLRLLRLFLLHFSTTMGQVFCYQWRSLQQVLFNSFSFISFSRVHVGPFPASTADRSSPVPG